MEHRSVWLVVYVATTVVLFVLWSNTTATVFVINSNFKIYTRDYGKDQNPIIRYRYNNVIVQHNLVTIIKFLYHGLTDYMHLWIQENQ
ncbi:hypothetical protein BLOT_016564 [Blomia tropicalis]|nr:hypothetical protein BLOT_016564 [Blomia tropicalis]